MRKISIVQRRLEAGLNFTRAELRALERETTSTSPENDTSEDPFREIRKAISRSCDTEVAGCQPQEDPYSSEGAFEERGLTPQGQTRPGSAERPGAPTLVRTREAERPLYSWERMAEATTSGNAGEGAEAPDGEEPVGEAAKAETDVSTEEASRRATGDWDSPSFFSEAARTIIRQEGTPDGDAVSQPKDESQAIPSAEVTAPGNSLDHHSLVMFLLQVSERHGLAASFSAADEEDSPFAGQLRLHKGAYSTENGGALNSLFDVNLPSDGLVRLTVGHFGEAEGGWALVTLDGKAHRHATFDLRGESNLRATAAVFGDTPVQKADLRIATGLTRDTGLVVANPTASPVRVILRLVDEQGRQVGEKACSELSPLQPGRQVALFAKQSFPEVDGLPEFRGRMVAEVEGEGVIWVAGLSRKDENLSFLPAEEVGQAHP